MHKSLYGRVLQEYPITHHWINNMQFNICRLTNVPLLSLSLYSWIHEWRDKTILVFWFATWAGSLRYPSLVSQETVDPLLIKFVPWRWLYISLVWFYVLMDRNLATLTNSNKCWTLHCIFQLFRERSEKCARNNPEG